MAGDVPQILDLQEDEDSALKAGWAALARVEQHNELRTAYYELANVVKRISPIIPMEYYQAASTLGWCAAGVDKLTQRCTVEELAWPDGIPEPERGIGVVWDDNYLQDEFSAAFTSAAIYGPSWVIVSKGLEDEGEPPVLVHSRDARNATGEWDARRRALRTFVTIDERSESGQEVTALTIMLPNKTVTCTRTERGWTVERGEHDFGLTVTPLPYKALPGLRPFGRSRITLAAMQAQDRATRTLVRLEGMSDIYSFAEQILLGADPSAFDTSGGTSTGWARVMGRWKGLPDADDVDDPKLARAEVEQLAASTPEPHLAAYKLHVGVFAGEMSMPPTELGVMSEVNSSTQDSSENAQQALIDLADACKEQWRPRLSRVSVHALAMLNGVPLDKVPDEWRRVVPRFRDSRYISVSAAADAGSKIVAAVPRLAETEVGLRKLGFTDDEIVAIRSEWRRTDGRAAAQAIAGAAAAVRAGAQPAPPVTTAPAPA